jgi:16S rRNA (adenine1518-N6/adenine1519-N6)-dimethyltransferase
LRRLGQHFLNDPNILRRIADALEPAAGEVVLEIGPGKGSLTRELLGRGVKVVAIEKDRRLAEDLRNAGWGMGDAGCVSIIEGDALTADWHALVRGATHPPSRIPHPVFSVLGNIPYAITTPLIAKALTPPLPQRIVFLVQEEVADRVVAAPGSKTYGALSVGVQALCRAEKLDTVRAGAFVPPPKVQSAVLRLVPLAQPLLEPAVAAGPFRRFVTACFSRRRKQLRNVLRAVTGRPAGEVSAALTALGIDPAARPETLSPAKFVALLHWRQRL